MGVWIYLPVWKTLHFFLLSETAVMLMGVTAPTREFAHSTNLSFLWESVCHVFFSLN